MAKDFYKLFVVAGCPFCDKAIDLMLERRFNFSAEYFQSDDIELNEAKQKESWGTVPMIWRGGEFIGGFTDLWKVLENGTEEEKN